MSEQFDHFVGVIDERHQEWHRNYAPHDLVRLRVVRKSDGAYRDRVWDSEADHEKVFAEMETLRMHDGPAPELDI